MNQTVDAGDDLDERTKVGQIPDHTFDLAADAIGLRDLLPGVGLGRSQRKREATLVDIDLGDHDLDLLFNFEDRARVLYLLCPRHFTDVDQSLDALLEDDEGAIVNNADHLALNPFNHPRARSLFTEIKELIDSGVPVVMSSQTIFGRINMNVYTSGRMLREIGVIGHLCDWTPETAYVKLMWVLGHTKKMNEVKEMMETNMVGEITEHSEVMKRLVV